MKSNKKDQEEQEQTRHFDAMAQFWRQFVNQENIGDTEKIQENNYSYQQYVEDKKNNDQPIQTIRDSKL